ncbi:MAG: hypothetical protein KA354_18085 [Phycisphaerae bacterium]|nr:hypothetical protein [Phycisphaerae bacterium]
MRWLRLVASLLAASSSALADGLVHRVVVDRSRYGPGDSVTITAELNNATGSPWSGWLSVEIWKSTTLLHALGRNITVPPGPKTEILTWTAPPLDYRGYTLVARAGGASASTALDVSSTWTRYPRYGYLRNWTATPSRWHGHRPWMIRALSGTRSGATLSSSPAKASRTSRTRLSLRFHLCLHGASHRSMWERIR